MLSLKSRSCRVLKFKNLTDFCTLATRTSCTQAHRTAIRTLENLKTALLNFELTTSRKCSIIQDIFDEAGNPIKNLKNLNSKPFRILLSKPFIYYVRYGKKTVIDTDLIDNFNGYQSSATINLYSYLTWFEQFKHPRLNIKTNTLLSKIGRLELLDHSLQQRIQAIKHHVSMLNAGLLKLGYDHQYEIRIYRPKGKTTEVDEANPVLRIRKVITAKRIKPLDYLNRACPDSESHERIETNQEVEDCDSYEKPLSFVTKLRKAFNYGIKKVLTAGGFQQRDLPSVWCESAPEP